MYTDPLTNSSNWLVCHSCGVKGDTIELYGKIHKIDNIPEALRKAITDGLATGSVDTSVDSVTSYINNYPARRATHVAIWEQLQNNLTQNPHADVIHRLQSEHLWGGYSHKSNRRFTRFLGGGIKREVDRLFDRAVLPRDFRNVLALNYQDAPGRSCTIEFRNDEGRSIFKFLSEPSNNKKEGGLAMLDVLRPYEGTVFALGDVEAALQLQRLWLNVSQEPAKIVIYNDHTDKAWGSVQADRVILWDNGLSWRTFEHARKVNNAHITRLPCMRSRNENTYGYIMDTTPAQVFDIMKRHAQPWHQVFAEWLTDPETPEHIAREAVHQLALNTFDRNKTLDLCSGARKNKLESLLGSLQVVNKAIFNRHEVIELENGWYVYYSANSQENISDVIIRLHQEIYNKHSGKIFWKGALKFKGRAIPFSESIEIIERDTEGWLRRLTASEGLGTPVLRPNWVRHLLNIAKTFSNPTSVEAEFKLGVQSNGEVFMPRFRLVNGAIAEEMTPTRMEGMPALDVQPPVLRRPDRGDKICPSRAMYAAVASAFVMNQLRRQRGMTPRPTAVIGSTGSVGRTVIRHFAETLGMKNFVIMKPAEIDSVRSWVKTFDFPALVETTESKKLADYPPTNNDDVFVACNEMEAASFGVGGGWLILNGMQTYNDTQPLPPIDDVFNYLLDLQERSMEIISEPDESLIVAVLRDFCRWYADYLNLDEALLFREANHMLQAPSAGESLINLYIAMVKQDKLVCNCSDFMKALAVHSEPRGGAVLIDNIENKVLLNRRLLAAAMKQNGLPRPDFSMATRDLVGKDILRPCNDQEKGWIIEKDFWETSVRLWTHQMVPYDSKDQV